MSAVQAKRQPGFDAGAPGTISRNPTTDAVIARYPFLTEAEIDAKLASTHKAYQAWRAVPVVQRAAVIKRVSEIFERDADKLAGLITDEMGKTLKEAKAEVLKCSKMAAYYSEHGPAMLADERAPIDEAEVYVSYLPLGTVLAVMPWNFPMWQAVRAAVPIMLGGNAFLLKHASNVVGCAYALAEVWAEARAPAGAFGVLNVHSSTIESVIADPRIAAVTLTGSVGAGSKVAAAAGKALKKSVLELGGSDAFIVLADADLDKAVASGVSSRLANAGQVCLAAKRFILEAPIAAAFSEKFVAAMKAAKVGDPRDATTVFGPQARSDLRDELHGQVETSVREGAKLLAGGRKIDGRGYFYEPTVLGDVGAGMTCYREELFGPVASLIVARDAEHAIEIANDSEFGLSANLWTGDLDRARAMARRLEAGGAFINGASASDPRIPIGGVKKSGYGRELSYFGVREFVNAQTVWVRQP